MICGSVSSARVKADGYMLMPFLQLPKSPEWELQRLQKEREKIRKVMERTQTRMKNIARRLAELEEEIKRGNEESRDHSDQAGHRGRAEKADS